MVFQITDQLPSLTSLEENTLMSINNRLWQREARTKLKPTSFTPISQALLNSWLVSVGMFLSHFSPFFLSQLLQSDFLFFLNLLSHEFHQSSWHVQLWAAVSSFWSQLDLPLSSVWTAPDQQMVVISHC